jgi:hypothetical protein
MIFASLHSPLYNLSIPHIISYNLSSILQFFLPARHLRYVTQSTLSLNKVITISISYNKKKGKAESNHDMPETRFSLSTSSQQLVGLLNGGQDEAALSWM